MKEEKNNKTLNEALPWGFWATSILGIAIIVVYTVVQLLVGLLYAMIKASSMGSDYLMILYSLENTGLFLALVTLFSAPIAIGLIFLLIKLRRGATLKSYLNLNSIERRRLTKWLAITLIFIVLYDSLTISLGKPIVPEFLITAFQTAGFAPLLWFAIIIAAPLFEEIFFRGFLFKGFQHSKIGVKGAVLLTSLIWTAIHLQYSFYELSQIFVLGIIFGIARHKTQSLYTTLAMHSVHNLIATIEVAVYLRMI
jgi:membrane protease YdiL (CAAX protease family)